MLKKELLAPHTFFPSCHWIRVFPFFSPSLESSAFLPQRHFWFWKGEILNYGEPGWRPHAAADPPHGAAAGLSWGRLPETRRGLCEWPRARHGQWAPRGKSTVSLKPLANGREGTQMGSFPPFSLMLKLPRLLLSEHLGMHRATKYGKGLREVKCTSVRRTGECITVNT